jgi:hypothetical protein
MEAVETPLEVKVVPNSKVVTIKLSTPTQLNGKEYTEITMDFKGFKGKHVIELESAFRSMYKEYTPIPDVDVRYLAIVAGYASKINAKDLEELDAPDFKEVCSAVRNFIIK